MEFHDAVLKKKLIKKLLKGRIKARKKNKLIARRIHEKEKVLPNKKKKNQIFYQPAN